MIQLRASFVIFRETGEMADVSAEEGESNQQIEGTDVLKYRCCMIQASGDMM